MLNTVLSLVAEQEPRRFLLPAELNTAGKRVNQVHTLAGSSKLQQQLCGLNFQLSPLAFFQTNSKQTEVMYNEVALAAGIFSCLSMRSAINNAFAASGPHSHMLHAAVASDVLSELLRNHAEAPKTASQYIGGM